MTNKTPEIRETDLRLLSDARSQYTAMRIALLATVERLQIGDETLKGKDIDGSIMGLRKSIQSVIDIEANLAKRSYENRSGGEGACPLDLAAARREITERLVKLSDARRSERTA